MLSGFSFPEGRMNVGKTLFAQVMEFVPWKIFGRIIDRRNGDAGVRTLGCADLFRIMAFSQLTCASRCATLRCAWKPIRPSCFTWASTLRPPVPH